MLARPLARSLANPLARQLAASENNLSTLAKAYAAALGYSPPAIQRINKAFQVLQDAAILDVLVEGAYYGTDGNLATGNPISLRAVPAAAMTGTFARGRYGLTADQSDVQGIGHNIAATNSGTFLVDETPLIPSSGFASFSPIISIGTTAPTTSSHQYGYALTSVPRIQSFNDAGSYVNDSPYSNAGATSGSRLIDPQSWRSSIHGANYGYTSHRAWINGVRSDLVGSTFAAATAAYKTRVSLFRRPANGTTFSNPASPKIQYVGTITSWMLFSRELSNTEASAATRAMTVLRGNSKALIVEGDSLSDAIFGATPVRSRDNWAYAVTQNSAWADHLLINAAASGHQVSGMVSSNNFTTQCLPFMPRDYIRKATYCIAGGINDFGASGATTAAAVYANIRTLVDLAKAAGARTVVATIPTPASSWTSLNSGANGTRLAELNTLIRNGHTAGHFDFLVDANTAVPAYDVDASKWFDTVHPNAAGNALWAAAFLAAVTT